MLSLLLSGAIFGFFYAWVCSTMWGLDSIDPRIAIAAMNGMNNSVQNAVFAPAFFGTPVVLMLTAALAWRAQRQAALLFAAAGVVYLFGGVILTMAMNVPMNRVLDATVIPEQIDAARAIWRSYSEPWQFWNTVRTLASGATLTLTGLGLLSLSRAS